MLIFYSIGPAVRFTRTLQLFGNSHIRYYLWLIRAICLGMCECCGGPASTPAITKLACPFRSE